MGPIPVESVAEEACVILQDELCAKLPGMFVCFVKMFLPDEDRPIVFGEYSPFTSVVHLREKYGDPMPGPVACVEIQGRPKYNPEYSDDCIAMMVHKDYYAMYAVGHAPVGPATCETYVYKDGLSPKQLADKLYKILVCEMSPD